MIAKKIFISIPLIFTSTLYSFAIPEFFSSLFSTAQQETFMQEYDFPAHATLELYNTSGDILIKTWKHTKIVVEAIKKGTPESLKTTTISVKFNNQSMVISTLAPHDSPAATVIYTILVPQHAILKQISTDKGSITIKHVQGNINAATNEGPIAIHDACADVRAKTNLGSITLEQKKLPETAGVFLETLQGNVQVFVPRNINANLQARTLKGELRTDIPVTMLPQTVKLNKDTWNRLRREVKATLGEGGAPITIDVTKGSIEVLEY
jgi:hypothetical protein